MKRLMTADGIAFILVILLSVGALIVAGRFPRMEGAYSDPGSFPTALAVVLAGLALAGLFHTARGTMAAEPVEESESNVTRRLLILGALTAGYLLWVPYIGFISGTALFFACAIAVLGYRRFSPALAVGFVFAFGLYWVFGILMNVSLPQGWIG